MMAHAASSSDGVLRGNVHVTILPPLPGNNAEQAALTTFWGGAPEDRRGAADEPIDALPVNLANENVAIAVAAIIGMASEKPLCVSSSTSTRPANGACIEAPIIAAAPTRRKAPTGVPGQQVIQSAPKNAHEERAGSRGTA